MDSAGIKTSLRNPIESSGFGTSFKKGLTVEGLKKGRRPHSLVQILGGKLEILAPNEILKETRN